MPEDSDELTRHYRGMRRDLLAALDGITDDLLMEPSLDGWSVANHLVHIAAWDELRAREIERISAGHVAAWPVEGDSGDIYNDLVFATRGRFSAAQARWEIATSHERLLAAIAAATERGLDGTLFGEAGLRSTHEAQHTGWLRRWRGERGLV